ncbi:MAG: ASCH domain-containing protein [Candidatus Diapherotrites archaeon]
MKVLGFNRSEVKSVLDGKKFTTWRIFRPYYQSVRKGMRIELAVSPALTVFAVARVLKARKTTFQNLNREDWKGHEKYASKNEMFRAFSRIYGVKIGPKTALKIIQFKVIEKRAPKQWR